jgi:hypothetical protein
VFELVKQSTFENGTAKIEIALIRASVFFGISFKNNENINKLPK